MEPGSEREPEREAARPEHLEHPGVLGQDLGDERGDAGLVRPARQLLEQQRRDAAPLAARRRRRTRPRPSRGRSGRSCRCR